MIKVFSSILARVRHLVAAAQATEADAERWRRDPLAHPAIAAMSQRELADLPMTGAACRFCAAEG